MNNAFKFFLCAIATCMGVRALAGEPNHFPADMTRGNVRVVLMSVGQTTVFPNEVDRAAKGPPWLVLPERSPHDAAAVPCFTVTFLVEALGNRPFDGKTLKGVEVIQDGKPVEFVNRRGEYHQWFDYDAFPDILDFTKPKVADAKRAMIMRYVRFGALPNLRPLTLRFDTGFDDDVEQFEFSAISLQ